MGLWHLREKLPLVLALVAIILLATLPPGPIGYVRFRVPVMPVITALEVAGVALLIQQLSTSRRVLGRRIQAAITPAATARTRHT